MGIYRNAGLGRAGREESILDTYFLLQKLLHLQQRSHIQTHIHAPYLNGLASVSLTHIDVTYNPSLCSQGTC